MSWDQEIAVDDRHHAFASGLSREERLLVELRDVIYDGSWQSLREDLLARRDRRPFIIKLSTRIDDDLSRIEKLEAYERSHALDLREHLPDYE